MPGDRIDEAELRARLSLSGTPVREALISLEAAGIVERIPRGGARILELSLEGLVQLVETLAEIEGAIAYRAARRINPHQAAALEEAAQACAARAGTHPPGDPGYYDVNLAFHMALVNAAGNEHLKQTVFNIGNRLIAYLSARHALPGEAQRSARQHADICRAVLASDGDLARELMIQHVIFNDTLALDVMNILRQGV